MIDADTARESHLLQFDDVELRCLDFGGTGTAVLLLHGLCGTADEWVDTAAWLRKTHRVIAFDQRGHGQSTRRPPEVTPDAYINDAMRVLQTFGVTRTVVIGQSMGGRIAFALAAQHPSSVQRLVVVEATPAFNPRVFDNISALLNAWPVPFESRGAARQFFGGDSLSAIIWSQSLEERPDGLWPRFDVDIMLKTIKESEAIDWWPLWNRVAQPTLVVGGGNSSSLQRSDFARMIDCVPQATYVSVDGAGHDVHLDRPDDWREVVLGFLQQSASGQH